MYRKISPGITKIERNLGHKNQMTSILKVMYYVGVFILLQILKCMIQHRHTILLTPLCWKKIFWSRNSNEIGFALSKSSIFDSSKTFFSIRATNVQTFLRIQKAE